MSLCRRTRQSGHFRPLRTDEQADAHRATDRSAPVPSMKRNWCLAVVRVCILYCLPVILVACSRGQLRSSSQFDEAKVLFAPAYSACDAGAAEACSRLAFQMADWGERSRVSVVVALHELACRDAVLASCVELAIIDFKRNRSQTSRLSSYCHGERSVRACEVLAGTGDVAAAIVACRFGVRVACHQLNGLWKANPPGDEARLFFADLCSLGRGEACVLAADWLSDSGPTPKSADGPTHRHLLAKACEASQNPNCYRIDEAVVALAAGVGVTSECAEFRAAVSRACVEFSRCRAQTFCRAAAGDAKAQSLLQTSCRRDPEGSDCALLLEAAQPSHPRSVMPD